MMLKAVQTTLDGGKEDMSLYDWYAKVLEDNKQTLQRITSVLVADSAFSKKPFVDKMQRIGFNVVSRLHHDAAQYYLWDGEPTGKPGRPHIKGDKIDFDDIDKTKATQLDTDESTGQVYVLKAWCKSLQRKISQVIHILSGGGHRLYFSTNENMSGRDVMDYYCTRFHIEFCFRDAKQFVGLTDCQARDKENLILPSTLHLQL